MAPQPELREIAALAAAEAAHCHHELATPAHLLTALLIWDERVDGTLRRSTGIAAKSLRAQVRKTSPGGHGRPGFPSPLSEEVKDLLKAAATPEELLRSLLADPELTDLMRRAGGDPGAAHMAPTVAVPSCPACGRPLSEGVRAQDFRTLVGGAPRSMTAWTCRGCGRLLGVSAAEEGRSRGRFGRP